MAFRWSGYWSWTFQNSTALPAIQRKEREAMANAHDLALATITNLNTTRHSPERAAHKLKMIRIAERAALNLPPIGNEMEEITAAAEYCEVMGA